MSTPKKKSNLTADMLADISAPASMIPDTPPANFVKISVSLFRPEAEATAILMEKMRRNHDGLVSRSDAFKLALQFAAETMTDKDIRERIGLIKAQDKRRR